MCAIISSLTEFKDSSRADIQPSSVSKLTPSPNLRGKDLQHSPSTICLSIKFRFGSCADVWDVEGAIPYHQSLLPDNPEFIHLSLFEVFASRPLPDKPKSVYS